MSLPSFAAIAAVAVAVLASSTAAAAGPPLAASIETTRAALQAREFVAYEPGHGWMPGHAVSPTQLHDELTVLRATGANGVITYGMTDGLDQVPAIAKSVGFLYVIVGLWNPAEEWNLINAGNLPWIDGILIGNEGICRRLAVCGSGTPNWTAQDLVNWVVAARQQWPGRLVLTAELWRLYDSGQTVFQPQLMTLAAGDVVFPNLSPGWDQSQHVEFCPQVGREFVENVIRLNIQPGNSQMLPIVIHEAWWPSEPTSNTCNGLLGCPGVPNGYSEAAQGRFFSLLEGTDLSFVWGEAYDQPWKMETSNGCGAPLGQHWGLWRNDGTPKLVVDVVDRTLFRDGFEAGDVSAWSAAGP